MTDPILAQGVITADLVEDRHYLAPGSTYELIVEITNSANSGFVMSDYRGGGYDPNSWHNSPPYFELKLHESCAPYGFCPVDSDAGLPLNPGESGRFYHRVIHVSPDAPIGAEIRISDIHVTLFDGEQNRQHNDIHLARNFVGIVSPNGQGDQAALATIPTVNPRAGSANIDATLSLAYPTSVKAGEHLEVVGTITNHGPEPISDLFILGTHRHLGTHVRSYRQIFCVFKCEFNGRLPLYQGESIDLLFRQIYYENEMLSRGNLLLSGPHANIRDSHNRRAYLYAEDISVTVTHDSDAPTPAPEFYLPEREPLLLTTTVDDTRREVVFDPNTGRSWLPLTETQGMFFHHVINATRPGGKFEGFSVANSNEVKTLMLNHIYASKLEYPDYALFVGNADLHAVAGTFLDLIGTTLVPEHESGSTRYGRGFVADAPEPGNEAVEVGVWQQNNPGGLFGLNGSFTRHSAGYRGYTGTGTWLVSDRILVAETIGVVDEAIKSAEEVEYEYGQLFIASVDVDGYTYKVTLEMINKEEVIIELISALDEFNRAPSATYDVTSLILQIPRLGLFVFPDNHLYFSVELELIPGTNPPQFRLIYAEDVN